MKKIIFVIFAAIIMQGCLVGHKMVYEITPKGAGAGNATIWYHDIRSDAANGQEFQEDQNLLFDYMLKSEKFVQDLMREGKSVAKRNLYLEDNKLIGQVNFNFNKLGDVEGIVFDDGFYFLTLDLADSVISTNGVIIKSPEYKRILWDSTITKLKFEIYTEPENQKLLELAPLYQPQY